MSDPLCREPDSDAPCRFATVCHESRQRLMHYEGLRGMACWAYAMLIGRTFSADDTKGER